MNRRYFLWLLRRRKHRRCSGRKMPYVSLQIHTNGRPTQDHYSGSFPTWFLGLFRAWQACLLAMGSICTHSGTQVLLGYDESDGSCSMVSVSALIKQGLWWWLTCLLGTICCQVRWILPCNGFVTTPENPGPVFISSKITPGDTGNVLAETKGQP